MSTAFEYGTVSNAEEAQQFGAILEQCFNSPPNSENRFIDRAGLQNVRLVRQSGQIAGGLVILHLGQWYGSECVPMAGIASVGIAPEYRGSGAAIALMHETVKELHASGTPISVLYPAVQRLYRAAGYEQGGSRCLWEVPTASIGLSDRTLPIQPVSCKSSEVFADIYQQQAKTTNGYLERSQVMWKELLDERDSPIYAYLIGQTQPEGYIIFTQKSDSRIMIKDWALLTAAAVRRFWTFIADHRSQIEKVQWWSSVVDSLTLKLPEQTAKVTGSQRWMLRIVDVSRALKQRGYPNGIETKLHLEVRDDFVAENNGRFILTVANGRGEVTQGGRGELQIDLRGLASLYTGLFTPQQLQQMGQLNATKPALTAATLLFTGSSPWMADFF